MHVEGELKYTRAVTTQIQASEFTASFARKMSDSLCMGWCDCYVPIPQVKYHLRVFSLVGAGTSAARCGVSKP